MEMQLLPWIKDDIAIEIIGKMIAEQTEQLYQLLEEFDSAGFSRSEPEVLSHPTYQQCMKRIEEFKAEIDQIYAGTDLEYIYNKVDKEYVPHLGYRRGAVTVIA